MAHAGETGSLGEDEVYLWIAPLTTAPERFSHFGSIVSVDEKEARRFRKISDGERYLTARGWLRYLLASDAADEPDQLQFRYGVFGKPSLSNETPKTILNVSLSHSGDQGLFGIYARAKNRAVDLERVRRDVDVLALAKSYFSPDEFRRLRQLPVSDTACFTAHGLVSRLISKLAAKAFHLAWTRWKLVLF